jgi:hypothetical protein
VVTQAMKKKLIILVAIFLVLSFTTVYGTTAIYGYFKGNEIVKLKINGNEVVSSVPAVMLEGTTMVPLRAVGENLDVIIGWNGPERTVELIKPNANMLFTANPVYDSVNKSYLVYSPFGKINKTQRYNFSFHVFCEIDSLPYEEIQIMVRLVDPSGAIVSESTKQSYDASRENSLQYISQFENINFTTSGNYKVEALISGPSTTNKFVKIGEKLISVK